MQGKLIISSFDEEEDIFRTDVICGISGINDYDYQICIRTPLEGSFEELISKPYGFDESITFNIDIADIRKILIFLKKLKIIDYNS